MSWFWFIAGVLFGSVQTYGICLLRRYDTDEPARNSTAGNLDERKTR